MALTTSGGASILTPEEVGALVIRPLMETSVAAQVSTVVPTTSHDFRVPIVSADPAAAWTAEGAEITASDPTITEVLVTPKKLAGLTVISNARQNSHAGPKVLYRFGVRFGLMGVPPGTWGRTPNRLTRNTNER